ncbi:hypothetical protein GCM10007424_01980 [Flavobacterium suaedae]|uniref:Uncharacterized protein n=1 Tax=Flavobacterium suaedae TaxID=1767027 RepID=A0ABQ1JGE8_9FLAO|nr:hypothetical protein [Flavobacterium suaedae]GGB65655.1 hypothetical protein GCM10007424_01980 [Flavobacterium suaedae]
MKQIKYYTLGLLSVALLTVGLYSCSNEDNSDIQNNEASKTVWNKSNDDVRGGLVAKIENGVAVALYDEKEAKDLLVDSGTFTDVESIELAYGLNPDTNQYEAFVTLIATEASTSMVVGIVADLTIEGDKLIIPNPETEYQAFAKHSCTPKNCSWCQFDRSWFLGRIKGCDCNRAAEEGKPSSCLHGLNSGPAPGLPELVSTLTKLAAGI